MRHQQFTCGIRVMAVLLVTSGTSAQESEHQYVYCDTGIRCIRAPCPSRSARDLQTGEKLLGVHLDLSGLSKAERHRSYLQIALYRGTIVLGGQKSTAKSPGGSGTINAILVRRIVRESTRAERSHCSYKG